MGDYVWYPDGSFEWDPDAKAEPFDPKGLPPEWDPHHPMHKHEFVDEHGVFHEDIYKRWHNYTANVEGYITPNSDTDPQTWFRNVMDRREEIDNKFDDVVDSYYTGWGDNLSPDQFFNRED